jgi:membrane-bound ClpP family serine protease
MEPWLWAVLLLIVGLFVAILEVFLPSGGILGFVAVVTLVGAVTVGFFQSIETGAAILGSAILGVPIVLILGFRWWPYTSIGKRVLLQAPSQDEVLPDTPKRRDLKNLIGRVGKAKSDMLLSGAVAIDGRLYDAVSEALPIVMGQPVRVIHVRGAEIVVRAVEAGESLDNRAADDPLAQPIDSVAADPFEEPPLDFSPRNG